MKKTTPRYKRFTRSKIGNFFFFAVLIAAGLFTVLPLIYSIITSFKPLDELLAFPPKFYVIRPTLKNYTILPELMSDLEVPFSRYVANTLLISMETLKTEEARLRAQYELAYDLNSIESTMTSSGAMVKPQSSQIFYVDLSAPDSVTYFEQEDPVEGLRGAWEGLRSVWGNVVEYFQ